MVKAPSPLLGFNNNVPHRGRVFHVQTEDSGIRHPHIITHLFADGGRILKTTKTSYAEHLGRPEMAETVRGMMQEQHKAMIIALRDGQYDYLFDKSAASGVPSASPSQKGSGPVSPPAATPPAATPPAAAAPAAAPPAVAPLATAPPSAAAPPATAPSAKAPSVPPAAAAAPEVSTPKPSPLDLARRPALNAEPAPSAVAPAPPPLPSEDKGDPGSVPRRATPRPKLQVSPEALHVRDTGPSAPEVTLPPDLPPPRPQHKSGIDLDLEVLERAAVEAQTSFFQQINDLPPPPAAVVGKKPSSTSSSGTFAAIAGGAPAADAGNAPKPQVSPIRSPPPPAPAQPTTGGTGRYAPARLPPIFLKNTRPQEGSSIFGEDLISEKSLDEVILSYLAEDLEGPGDKK